MTPNPLARLHELGQSIWYDYIRRDLMTTGTLAGLIEQDRLAGMTSNPTIFDQAISDSVLYDKEIRTAAPGQTAAQLFDTIAVADIQQAADQFLPVYQQSGKKDGYVSLEVSPELARDTEQTVSEARRLFKVCGRPNVMIKIPGTSEGLPAVEACLSEGINVNITLLFSVRRYREVMEAWLSALESRRATGQAIDGIASVASFFVSRVDSKVDQAIDARLAGPDSDAAREPLSALKSKLGIHNARLAYQAWAEDVRDSARFRALKEAGAMVQRPLWASTSTKDPALPDVYYIDALAGPDSVNTVPPHTYDAYREHGEPADRIGQDIDQARAALATLASHGIDFDAICEQLEVEGVDKFARSFQDLLASITAKMERIQSS